MSDSNTPRGIERAIEVAGGAAALAQQMGVSHQVVYQWKKRGWLPPARAIEVESRYGVPRIEMVNPKILDLVGM